MHHSVHRPSHRIRLRLAQTLSSCHSRICSPSTSNRPSLSSLALPQTPLCSLYPSLSSHVAPARRQPSFYAASKYVRKHHPLALAFTFVLLLKPIIPRPHLSVLICLTILSSALHLGRAAPTSLKYSSLLNVHCVRTRDHFSIKSLLYGITTSSAHVLSR